MEYTVMKRLIVSAVEIASSTCLAVDSDSNFQTRTVMIILSINHSRFFIPLVFIFVRASIILSDELQNSFTTYFGNRLFTE
jgi:hypothetical protein